MFISASSRLWPAAEAAGRAEWVELVAECAEATLRGRDPDFLLIGAMKSGTTTLYEYLCRHPKVFMCTPKEPGFFSRDRVRARGIDWYRGLFADAESEQICGEASTCYSRWPHYGDVAARIAAQLPNVKLVYVMRHPVQRAYSHYRHAMHERMQEAGLPSLSFERAIAEVPEIVDASLYRAQIEQYLRQFPSEQLHCLTLEDLTARPDEVLEPLQRFLGLEPLPLAAQGPVTANPDGTAVALRNAQKSIDRARRIPLLSGLARRLPEGARSRIRDWLKDPNVANRLWRRRVERSREELSPLDADMRRELLARFDEPTRDMAEFLARDLEEWRH